MLRRAGNARSQEVVAVKGSPIHGGGRRHGRGALRGGLWLPARSRGRAPSPRCQGRCDAWGRASGNRGGFRPAQPGLAPRPGCGRRHRAADDGGARAQGWHRAPCVAA
eukprot:5810547-Lingulodinium_polyedra.AAC.1